MATEQVQIQAVAELGEPGQGWRGEWLAYGELSVEVEQAVVAPPPPRRRSR